MTTIVTRAGKGSELTWPEVDANFTNLQTTADAAAPTSMVSLMPTVISAISPDIFGAAGATINYDNTTPVTATSFAACTAAQIGSRKTIIPTVNANFTASANLVVDGATSGTYAMPANAIVEVIPVTTTKFIVTTIFATGSWNPVATSVTGTITSYTSSGTYTKIGNVVTAHCAVAITDNGTGATNGLISPLPFACGAIGTVAAGRNGGTTGAMEAAIVIAGASYASIFKYDNSYPWGTGATSTFVFVYRV